MAGGVPGVGAPVIQGAEPQGSQACCKMKADHESCFIVKFDGAVDIVGEALHPNQLSDVRHTPTPLLRVLPHDQPLYPFLPTPPDKIKDNLVNLFLNMFLWGKDLSDVGKDRVKDRLHDLDSPRHRQCTGAPTAGLSACPAEGLSPALAPGVGPAKCNS